MRLLQELGAAMILLFALSAFPAQACDYTYGPCESPFLNPNIALHFEGVVCTTGAALNCGYEQYSVFDVYAAFDECYQENCGVVWDEGYCANFCNAALEQQERRTKEKVAKVKVNYSPAGFWKNLRSPVFVAVTKKRVPPIEVKSRFWWKHA